MARHFFSDWGRLPVSGLGRAAGLLILAVVHSGSNQAGVFVSGADPCVDPDVKSPGSSTRNPLGCDSPSGLESVTLVTVLFNSRHCLPALADLLLGCPSVILVDNGSTDDSATAARALVPQAQVIEAGRNLGFGAACNVALARVRTPFALLLNPDCELDAAAVVGLLAAAERWPQAALLAPQLVDGRGRAERNYRWPRTLWAARGPAAEGDCCVGHLCGAVWLLRMERVRDLGFFDARFFLYYEDDDLCLRLFRAGRPLMLIPSVTARHRARGSVGGRSRLQLEFGRGYHHAQSKLTFEGLHGAPARAQRLRRKTLLLTTLLLPLRVLVFSPRLVARMVGRWVGLWRWGLAALEPKGVEPESGG